MIGFNVSFAARHPLCDLSALLAPLGVAPKHCWKAGDQRRTPTGLILEGNYDSSYSSFDLPLPESDDLADWLKQAADFLRPAAKNLVSFVDSGGSLSFYIGLEKGAFGGAAIAPSLLAKLGELQISLDIDRDL